MTIAVKLLLTVALIFSIAVPFGAFAAGEKTKGRYKTALAANTVMFFGTMLRRLRTLWRHCIRSRVHSCSRRHLHRYGLHRSCSFHRTFLYRRRRCRFRGSIRSTWRYQ